ncbi:CHAT domain-containing protein [Nocardia nepalensis]|uniref:CHAT domain-containing protein n=1 Tax=Nocardia nepalensis TaxID=3375448 RepID=UPI003B66ECDE
MESWLRRRGSDAADLFLAAAHTDPTLAIALSERPEIGRALKLRAAEAWRNDDPDAVRLTVEWMGFGSPASLTSDIPGEFARMIKQLDPRKRVTAYEQVIDGLRYYAMQGTNDGHWIGWVSLLRNAGLAERQARRPNAAVTFLDEAWRNRRLLPKGTEQTAKALTALAVRYSEAIGWLPTENYITMSFDEQSRRMRVGCDALDQHPDTLESIQTRIRVAIQRSNMWYVRRKRGYAGYLTYAEQTRKLLTDAETDVWRRLLGLDIGCVAMDYRTLPTELGAAMVELLIALGRAASLLAEPELTERTSRDVLLLSEFAHHRFDAHLNLARDRPTLDERLRVDQDVLRDVEAGDLDTLNDHQRTRVYRRLRAECIELARILYREKKPTAAWFWTRQAQTWAPKQDSNGLPQIQRATTQDDVEQLEPTPAESNSVWFDTVMNHIRGENVIGLILQLRSGESDRTDAEVAAALAAAERWWPRKRRRDPDRRIVVEAASAAELRLAALHLATEFLDYAPYLGAQIDLELSKSAELTWEQRVDWLRRGISRAESAGRTAFSLNCWLQLMGLALQRTDQSLIDQAVAGIHRIIGRELAAVTGAADFIDIAEQLLRQSARAAGQLADHGHPNQAFRLAGAAAGALRRLIEEDPEVAEELELVEQRALYKTPPHDDALFTLMQRRVLAGSRGSMDSDPVALPDLDEGRSSLVQLLNARDAGCWALGRTNGEFWSVRLDLDADGLRELRETVWHQLGPRKSRAPILADLHRLVIAPIGPHLGQDDVTFVLHGAFSGLPLHAAYDGSTYLIERIRVSYLPTVGTDLDTALRPDALVGGWDPGIEAGTEATEVEQYLTRLGLDVTRPKKAIEGKRALLDAENHWGIVHIAAHGDFCPWPMSLRSRLRLSTRVSLDAGDWLRSSCRAAFVFMNACDVGMPALHAGDLNGFPLAVRARGAVASIAALAPVRSGAARRFAELYYTHWSLGDSLSAFQAACREVIASGESVSGWAPYLHTGSPVRLP